MALDDAALRQSISDPKHKGFVGEVFGRYEILSHLAKGGMGAVYRARHKELGQMVALKLLLRDDPSSEAVGRFKREAKVLASIKHPHIVGISDLGEDAGVNYIAMELIDGRNLHQIVRAPGGELPEFEWTAEVISHVARALAHCHEQGVIHRDVKPHNIIVEHGTGRAVLTDFGLVKRDPNKQLSGGGGGDASQVQSQAGALLGTPSFMSPEQFEPDGDFGAVEARTDVWGLGATLFFLLTGRPPFQGTNVVDLYHAVTTRPVPRATTLRASVPAALDELCARMLTKEVARRPTMAEVVLELEKLEGSLSRATSSRGLRHTAVLLLLLTVAVAVDVAWLHPARGQRIARLFTPQQQLILDAEPEPQPVDTAPAEPSAFEATALRAGAGELDAMVKLGLMLKAGRGCTPDPARAFEWFVKAGEGGDEAGMFWAGYCLARGVGAAKDEAKAREWFKRCAAEAHPIGMYWLGTFLAEGKGGPADPSGARDWFVKARDLGDAELKRKAIEQLSALRLAHPELQ